MMLENYKDLFRSDYNKIMLNFSGSLLMAFLVLAVIQVHGNDIYTFSGLCLILGHCNVFFFLASFTWMTIMSYFIFDQIHGYLDKSVLEMKEVSSLE